MCFLHVTELVYIEKHFLTTNQETCFICLYAVLTLLLKLSQSSYVIT